MISRRGLGGGWLALAGGASIGLAAPGRAAASDDPASVPAGVPAGRRLDFTIRRNGSAIGRHTLRFEAGADRLTIRIDVGISAGIGPLTLYRYRMQAVEIWEGGRFVSLESRAEDDGDRRAVTARRDDGGLAIAVQGAAQFRLPPDTLPLTHWNEAQMHSPLFNPETGQPMHDTVTPQGRMGLVQGDGRTLAAQQYALRGTDTIDDWYDDAHVWLSLRARAKDGSTITYDRVVSPG